MSNEPILATTIERRAERRRRMMEQQQLHAMANQQLQQIAQQQREQFHVEPAKSLNPFNVPPLASMFSTKIGVPKTKSIRDMARQRKRAPVLKSAPLVSPPKMAKPAVSVPKTAVSVPKPVVHPPAPSQETKSASQETKSASQETKSALKVDPPVSRSITHVSNIAQTKAIKPPQVPNRTATPTRRAVPLESKRAVPVAPAKSGPVAPAKSGPVAPAKSGPVQQQQSSVPPPEPDSNVHRFSEMWKHELEKPSKWNIDFVPDLKEPLNRDETKSYMERLQKYQIKWAGDSEVKTCIQNLMTKYFSADRMIDPDLSSTINWARVLIWLMDYCESKQDNRPGIGDDRLLYETFHSIGGTCIQGATHRILCLANALGESCPDNALGKSRPDNAPGKSHSVDKIIIERKE
jgi:hypothetical protein